jgi:hypothetical protein
VVDEDELLNEVLSSEGLLGGHCDVPHHVPTTRIEIYGQQDLGPLCELTGIDSPLGVLWAVDVVVKDGAFGGELGGGLPLRFPPIRELLTVVETVLLRETTSTTPNNCEDESELNVTELIPQHYLEDGAQGSNHGDRAHCDQQLTVLLDIEQCTLTVLIEEHFEVILPFCSVRNQLDLRQLL